MTDNTSQRTSANGVTVDTPTLGNGDDSRSTMSKRRAYTTLAILLTINLLNYVDRFTIAGVLTDLQTFFDTDDTIASLFNVSTCSVLLKRQQL